MYVLVTKIELADSVVSLNGENDDEYTFGDVAVLGQLGSFCFYSLLAQAVLLSLHVFLTSTQYERSQHRSNITLGKEGMEKAAQVRQGVKDAKRSGMTTPDERRAEQRKQSKPAAEPKEIEKERRRWFRVLLDRQSALGSDDSSTSRSEFGSGNSVVIQMMRSVSKKKSISENRSSPQPLRLVAVPPSPLQHRQLVPRPAQPKPPLQKRSQRFEGGGRFVRKPNLSRNLNHKHLTKHSTTMKKSSLISVSKPKKRLSPLGR